MGKIRPGPSRLIWRACQKAYRFMLSSFFMHIHLTATLIWENGIRA